MWSQNSDIRIKHLLAQFHWADIMIVFHESRNAVIGYSLHFVLLARQSCLLHFVLVARQSCLLHCMLVVRQACLLYFVLLAWQACLLHRSKRHGTYMGTRGKTLLAKKLCVDAISENYFIKRKQLSNEHLGKISPLIYVRCNVTLNELRTLTLWHTLTVIQNIHVPVWNL